MSETGSRLITVLEEKQMRQVLKGGIKISFQSVIYGMVCYVKICHARDEVRRKETFEKTV